MGSMITYLKRTYTVFNPPVVAKSKDALRFGILGAANIAPQGLLIPAKSHPDVIVAAVAARDPKKAEAFAKKHGIPVVHKNYDDLINDPTIDCIYNPLPIGLHYEWSIKALKAGKHVLLEKPSVSNAEEARSLFRHQVLSQPNGPIILEAFHYKFHPAWQTFLSLFKSEEVEEVVVKNLLHAGMFPKDDIRFNYSLSGGTLMDFGTYAVSAVRGVFKTAPESVTSATYREMPDGYDKQCDEAIYAEYGFRNGATAKISADLAARGGYWFPALTKNWPSYKDIQMNLTVNLRTKKANIEDGSQKTTKTSIVVHNYIAPHVWHRIDIITTTQLLKDGKVVKEEKQVDYKKAYKWLTEQKDRKGEEYWSSYRYELEEFVNHVKKRAGSGAWVEPEDSIQQMEMIDATYLKAGLPLRPTSKIV